MRLNFRISDGRPAEQTGQTFQANDVNEGFICLNEHNRSFGGCHEYEARICCKI